MSRVCKAVLLFHRRLLLSDNPILAFYTLNFNLAEGKIDGGIIVSDAGVWKINKNTKYQYSDDFKGWELLDKYL